MVPEPPRLPGPGEGHGAWGSRGAWEGCGPHGRGRRASLSPLKGRTFRVVFRLTDGEVACQKKTKPSRCYRNPLILAHKWQRARAGRSWGLCRNRHLLYLKVHVWIPTLKDSTQLPVERPHAGL